MKTLGETIEGLKRSDRIKIILPGGTNLKGKKNKVQWYIRRYKLDLQVAKTEISYIPVPLRRNLCKIVIIYAIY